MTVSWPSFTQTLDQHGSHLTRDTLRTLQINVGKMCNQACSHCHVEAGPHRTEIMTRSTMDRILQLLDRSPSIETVDLTGGAPEMNPHFRYLAQELRQRNLEVIDRCNLTILFQPGHQETAPFLAHHRIKIVASLPCYSKKNTDSQRGNGVFDLSIRGLQLLNRLGYGDPSTGLELDLVYNPLGAKLPPAQDSLEQEYKRELRELFDITFNRLYTITNMPIKRFMNQLKRNNAYEDYLKLLVNNFNKSSIDKVMCRAMLSLGWDGKIYDCDFNQMLEIPLGNSPVSIYDIETFDEINQRPIACADHCYGCTAGAGSSCGGSLT